MSGPEGEMEPLYVWEGGLDSRLRVEKETKRHRRTGRGGVRGALLEGIESVWKRGKRVEKDGERKEREGEGERERLTHHK